MSFLGRHILYKIFRLINNSYGNRAGQGLYPGHIHLQDEGEYPWINSDCDRAISGNWQNGSFQEFAPAYAVIEFYEDGSSKGTVLKYD